MKNTVTVQMLLCRLHGGVDVLGKEAVVIGMQNVSIGERNVDVKEVFMVMERKVAKERFHQN